MLKLELMAPIMPILQKNVDFYLPYSNLCRNFLCDASLKKAYMFFDVNKYCIALLIRLRDSENVIPAQKKLLQCGGSYRSEIILTVNKH